MQTKEELLRYESNHIKPLNRMDLDEGTFKIPFKTEIYRNWASIYEMNQVFNK